MLHGAIYIGSIRTHTSLLSTFHWFIILRLYIACQDAGPPPCLLGVSVMGGLVRGIRKDT